MAVGSDILGRLMTALAAGMLVAVLGGCSAGPASTPPAPSPTASAAQSITGSRPSSPALVRIVSPTPNQVIAGTTVHVVLQLQNAKIVAATTTNITPDTGHLHLFVDGVLVSMNYGLEQDVPVHPGTVALKAEFVAADHAPFNPRVYSPDVVITVK